MEASRSPTLFCVLYCNCEQLAHSASSYCLQKEFLEHGDIAESTQLRLSRSPKRVMRLLFCRVPRIDRKLGGIFVTAMHHALRHLVILSRHGLSFDTTSDSHLRSSFLLRSTLQRGDDIILIHHVFPAIHLFPQSERLLVGTVQVRVQPQKRLCRESITRSHTQRSMMRRTICYTSHRRR